MLCLSYQIYENCNIKLNCSAFHISLVFTHCGFTRWRRWLRHCASRRKIAGSIPDGVMINHFGHTMALGSTQPLTEMSTRNNSWTVNVAGEIVLISGSLPEPSRPPQACTGIAIFFTLSENQNEIIVRYSSLLQFSSHHFALNNVKLHNRKCWKFSRFYIRSIFQYCKFYF